ncbi:MAG: hypothetical protein R6X25_00655 [Candidatus Krumholzibacteriia bacterium]
MQRDNTRGSWRVAFGLFAMLMASGLLVAGCSNESPVEPIDQATGLAKGEAGWDVQDIGEMYGSETAFGFGCEMAMCFDNYDIQRWGWTNHLMDEGTYYFDLYAGAGQCDLEKGTLVGTVEVVYDADSVDVTYYTCGSYLLEEVHVYVGSEPLPMLRNGHWTVAPGQYTYTNDHVGGLNEYPVEIPYMNGDVYVIAHAVVSGDYSMGDCGEPGCDPFIPTPCEPGVYLADGGGSPVTLNRVEFDNGTANLIELVDFTGDNRFGFVNHIGATPDGAWVYVIAEDTGWVGRYSVAGDYFEPLGEIAGFPTGLVLVTIDPAGEYIYVGSQDTEEIFTVDISTLALSLLGDTGIDLHGADMTFRNDGMLYLITNSPVDAGLYTIDLTNGMATVVGGFPGAPEFVTGVALMPGTATIIVSDPERNEILEVFDGMDRVWSLSKNGMPFNHVWGDMASSLCPEDLD